MLKLVNLLVLFQRTSLAVSLCHDTYESVVKKKEAFWSSPEDKLAKVVFCCELQKMLLHLQAGGALNWKDFDRIVRRYGYDFNESTYLRFEKQLQGEIDSEEVRKQFKKGFVPALRDIQITFFSYMWNEKQIPFSTSEAISTSVLNFLANQIEGPRCGVDKFFKFTEASLEKHVASLVDGLLLPCPEEGFALVWSIPLVYKYLHAIELVDSKALAVVVKISDSIKNKLVSNFPGFKEVYHFISVADDEKI